MKSALPALALCALLGACADPAARVQAMSAADARTSAAVADQVRRCYRSPRVPSAGRRIVTRLLVRFTPDGKLIDLPMLMWQQGLTSESRPYAVRMTEAAKLAVIRCNPVRLPVEQGKAKSFEFFLTFSPQLAA